LISILICACYFLLGLSVLPYSSKWVNTRRRTITILRDLGMGKSFMEDRVIKESESCFHRSKLQRQRMWHSLTIIMGASRPLQPKWFHVWLNTMTILRIAWAVLCVIIA